MLLPKLIVSLCESSCRFQSCASLPQRAARAKAAVTAGSAPRALLPRSPGRCSCAGALSIAACRQMELLPGAPCSKPRQRQLLGRAACLSAPAALPGTAPCGVDPLQIPSRQAELQGCDWHFSNNLIEVHHSAMSEVRGGRILATWCLWGSGPLLLLGSL